jgi:K+-sensing histidine kinase KdpD
MNDASPQKAVQAELEWEPQSRVKTSLRRLAGSWWLLLVSSFAWLVVSGIVVRLTSATAAIMLLAAVFLLSASDELLGRARSGFPARRRLIGHALAAELALLLALVLAGWRSQPSPTTEVLGLLVAVIAVALAGGLIPAVIEAVAGSLLLCFLVTPQLGKPAMAGPDGAAVLGVLVGLAVVVSWLAEDAARRIMLAARTAEADRLVAEADQMRTALLTAVSHELRRPLASADAAVSCLRRPGVQLTAEHHHQLLATVEESLDQLTRVAVSLDINRQRAHSIDGRASSGRSSVLQPVLALKDEVEHQGSRGRTALGSPDRGAGT